MIITYGPRLWKLEYAALRVLPMGESRSSSTDHVYGRIPENTGQACGLLVKTIPCMPYAKQYEAGAIIDHIVDSYYDTYRSNFGSSVYTFPHSC